MTLMFPVKCRSVLAFCAALLLLAVCFGGTLRAQPVAKLELDKIEVKHVGPPAVSDELVRANIRLKPGDAYTKAGIDDDVRNLYNTGYFYNIRVVETITDYHVTLTYVVQGKPTLTEIRFEGNQKFSNKKLLGKITSKIGQPLDERKLFYDAEEIQKLYQKSGYQKTTVTNTPSINEQLGRGSVTFAINESPRVKIKDIEFVDAKAFPQRKLRGTLKTRRRWWLSWLTGSGVLKDEEFDEDKDKLGDFYRSKGYIDFEIRDIQFEQINPKWMKIKIAVNEGHQYKVGDVAFSGNTIYKTNELQRFVRMKVGSTFTP